MPLETLTRRAPGLLIALLGLTACAGDARDDRDTWLQNSLVADNRPWLERDPDAVAGKWAKMAADPFAFLRGTLGLYLRDVTRPGSELAVTGEGDAATALVALDGDPHPENLGTQRGADGATVVVINDYDAAQYGPFELDLARMASAFEVARLTIATRPVDPFPLDVPLGADVAEGYVAEIQALAAGATPLRLDRRHDVGTLLGDVLDKAQLDGDARTELTDSTVVVGGVRELKLGDLEPPDGLVVVNRLERLDDQTRQAAIDAIRAYAAGRAEPAGYFALKSLVRKRGEGVSSYPVIRLYALVEGPSPAVDDDVILDLKEEIDPFVVVGAPIFPGRRYASAADRVVAMTRAMQAPDERDPLLGVAAMGRLSLRVIGNSGYRKNVKVSKIGDKLVSGKLLPADVEELARQAGRLLARCHARALTADGQLGLGPLAAVIARDPDGLKARIADVADRLAATTLDDYARFLALLDADGPLLGYGEGPAW